jgi:hypothetical protein
MICLTTHTYALGRALGIDEASEELHRQIDKPDNQSLPVVRVIARLQTLDDLCIWTDSGATRIAESRSRAFHQALHCGADVWFACDDDCEATLDTIAWLVEAVRGRNGVCFAPYWARLSRERLPGINCNLPDVGTGERPFRTLSGGGKVVPANYGGMGLVAMSREAMIETANANERFTYTDTEGTTRIALFMEYIEKGFWLGEDVAFFRRLPTSVSVEALVTGHSMHHGNRLDLSIVGKNPPEIIPLPEEHEDHTDPSIEVTTVQN